MVSQITDDAAKTVQYILSPFGVNFQEMLKTCQQSAKSSDEQEEKEKWLKLSEATAFAKVSKWTIMRWARANKITAIKTSKSQTGRILVSKESLDALLKSLTIFPGTPEAK